MHDLQASGSVNGCHSVVAETTLPLSKVNHLIWLQHTSHEMTITIEAQQMERCDKTTTTARLRDN